MPILKKGSRTEFPAGGRVAEGRAASPFTMRRMQLTGIIYDAAFKEAVLAFRKEFGCDPESDRILFRGTITSKEVLVEICEID